MYSEFILDRLKSKHQTLQEYMYAISICFDYNVVQLFSLLEAHQKIKIHLKTSSERQKLEDSLSDTWKIIEAQKSRICIWRNNFIAHGKSSGKDGSFLIISDMDPDPIKAQTDLFRASKAAIIYISGFLRNIPEYLDAVSEYKSRQVGIEMPCPQYFKIDMDSILKSVKGSLEKNGFYSDLVTKL